MINGRILAVDDQRYFRELLEGLLTDVGLQVETAASGEEALAILDRSSFDVIVTDLVMPGMSGSELVARVKERDPDQEIVLVTGVVDVRSAVEAMKLGATDYLLKPFDRETLAGAITTILERRGLSAERDRLLAENIEYLGERSLFSRALKLLRAVTIETLAPRVLEALAEEAAAQSAVLWLESPDASDVLTLTSARGLVRVQEEREHLERALLDPKLRAGAATAFGGGDGGPTHPVLWVALRTGNRLIGVGRLTDKAGDAGFDDVDRACAEKLLQFAEAAFLNAERFQNLERRALQDPDTSAYHPDYLMGVVRNEIEKASRFGRSFGLLKISLGPLDALKSSLGQADFERWISELTRYLTRQLRSTDLAAADGSGTFWALLAETDTIGAASFRSRLQASLERCEALASLPERLRPPPALGAVACPGDGARFERLLDTLDERVERDQLGRMRDREFDALPLRECLRRILELGTPECLEAPVSIVEFGLREVGRRPRERNLLFLHAGDPYRDALHRWLEQRPEGRCASDVVAIAAPPLGNHNSEDTVWIAPERLAECPPFFVHFGDGPAYVLVSGDKPDVASGELLCFQSADRSLVEYLAFRLQRELGVPRLA